MAATILPITRDLEAYRGSTYFVLYRWLYTDGTVIDLANHHAEYRFRIFKRNKEDDPKIDLTWTGGGLSIAETNELSGIVAADKITSMHGGEKWFYELRFIRQDGSRDAHNAGRFFIRDITSTARANTTHSQHVYHTIEEAK